MTRKLTIILSICLLFIGSLFLISKGKSLDITGSKIKLRTDTLPLKNKKIIDYVIKHGPQISPTYEKAVCTELLIEVIKNFTPLSKEDKKRIRIICDTNVYLLRLQKSIIP